MEQTIHSSAAQPQAAGNYILGGGNDVTLAASFSAAGAATPKTREEFFKEHMDFSVDAHYQTAQGPRKGSISVSPLEGAELEEYQQEQDRMMEFARQRLERNPGDQVAIDRIESLEALQGTVPVKIETSITGPNSSTYQAVYPMDPHKIDPKSFFYNLQENGSALTSTLESAMRTITPENQLSEAGASMMIGSGMRQFFDPYAETKSNYGEGLQLPEASSASPQPEIWNDQLTL